MRDFFTKAALKNWFYIDSDVIRNEDYPKKHISNPDILCDSVREQIEKNLYRLPKPIARMWIICFFAALRPEELSSLQKDCLAKEGDKWKIVWSRNKSNDYHEVPVTRTIAKIIQEQRDYILPVKHKSVFLISTNIQKLNSKSVS